MKKIFSIILVIIFAIVVFCFFDWIIIPRMKAQQQKQFLIIADNVQANPFKKRLIEHIAQEITQKNAKIEVKIADLATLSLPQLSARVSPAQAPTVELKVKEWADQINAAHAIIFVIPNYHRGYPAIFKNAIDLIWEPWHTNR